MQTSRRLAVVAAVALAGLFAVAAITSILRRTETTYNYPRYSSLNNSEQGTKAYFDALERLGFLVSRNFKLLPKLAGARAAIFYAGPDLAQFRYSDESDLRDFERLAERGARVVIALDPEGLVETPKESRTEHPKKAAKPPEDNLKNRWGVQLSYRDRPVSSQNRAFLATLEMRPVNWQFSSWASSWIPSHVRKTAPLFLERAFGKGAIVLIADSKVFTNRELLVHPDTDVLAAAPGGYRRIIFDESHLGLEDTGTVVGLATAHNLQWMLVGFFVLASLYVWRSTSSFIPRTRARTEVAVSGRDAHLALSNLLMQSVPARSILRVAAEEWNRSAGLAARASARRVGEDDLAHLEGLPVERVVDRYRDLSVRVNTKIKIEGRRGAL
jgi:hypothetical protein